MLAANRCCLMAFLLAAALRLSIAQELSGVAKPPAGDPVVATLLRLPNKTLGGDQFWADEFVRGGWRIQRNVFTGSYRLLDPQDYRREYGKYEACLDRFCEIEAANPLPPPKKKAVVLLHGLLRSRDTMEPLGDFLAKEGGYEIVNVTYPSTRAEVRDHAASLDKVMKNMQGVEEVNFVAHSLGNIVTRQWMHEHCEKGMQQPFKLGRFAMLGPPNQGAQLARLFKDNQIFGLVTGPSGKQLSMGWDQLSENLCTPPCEFGILAGAAAIPNPLVTGAGDLILSVDETRLPGAADFRVLPVHHAGIRSDENVGKLVLTFLEKGYFSTADEQKPLPK